MVIDDGEGMDTARLQRFMTKEVHLPQLIRCTPFKALKSPGVPTCWGMHEVIAMEYLGDGALRRWLESQMCEPRMEFSRTPIWVRGTKVDDARLHLG